MRIQCAGCATIISDDGEGSGTTYGCCAECNQTSFRTHEHNEVKAPEPSAAQEAEAPAVTEESA